MGTKVKFQLTPDIHMFDPTKPCDNQVRYQVYIILKHIKNKESSPFYKPLFQWTSDVFGKLFLTTASVRNMCVVFIVQILLNVKF